jgi:hypothetical protein
MKPSTRLWTARILIGIVFAWNVQAALAFIVWPSSFVGAYQLNGVAGEAAVRGAGVLFLMWNVPYAPAFWHPIRHRLALILALVMQFIGLAGESLILGSLPSTYTTLSASVLRFILFDAAGLILLVLAYWLVKHESDPA